MRVASGGTIASVARICSRNVILCRTKSLCASLDYSSKQNSIYPTRRALADIARVVGCTILQRGDSKGQLYEMGLAFVVAGRVQERRASRRVWLQALYPAHRYPDRSIAVRADCTSLTRRITM